MRVDPYFEKELCQKRRNKKETAGKNLKRHNFPLVKDK